MTLNEAIRQVLTTQFKKDAPEAFECVANAGYVVNKYEGQWFVRNEKTSRSIAVSHHDTWDYKQRKYVVYYDLRCGGCTLYYRRTYHLEEFDFVNYLETPVNRPIMDENNKDWRLREWSKARLAYDSIKSAKHDEKHYTEEISRKSKEFTAKIQKLTEEYQRDIKFYTQYASSARERLKRLRKEYHLS